MSFGLVFVGLCFVFHKNMSNADISIHKFN